jgi:4,5-DOPA dioxygenase extradiol
MIARRAFLGGAALGVAAALAPGLARAASGRMPVAYVSHGVPLFMPGNEGRRAALRAWAERLPKPRAILVMTPHFASRALSLGMTREGFAWYDLPTQFKRMLPQDLEYRTPASAALGARVADLLDAPVQHAEERRGFDHTTWMPLKAMFPAADVPVLEIAYPYVTEAQVFALGKKLAPLRDEGVLFVASGGMTHNLAMGVEGPAPSFATDFDAWAAESLARCDVDALLDWRHRAPASLLAHPDDGAHFRVLLVALGVASGAARATFPITGFESALSLRCVELA